MRRHSVTYKLFFSMFFLCLSCLCIFAFCSNSLYSQALRTQEINYNLQASNKIKSQFDFTLNLVQTTSNTLVQSYQQSSLESTMLNKTALDYILDLQSFINAIYIVSPSGTLLESTLLDSSHFDHPFYGNYLNHSNLQLPTGELWTDIHNVCYASNKMTKVISYINPIYHPNNRSLIGFVIMDIDYDFMHTLFMVSSIEVNEKVMIVTNDGTILFNFPHFTSFEPVLKQYPIILESNKLQMSGKVFGKESIIVSENIQLADWKIVRMIQTNTLTTYTQKIASILKVLLLICGIVCLIGSLWLSSLLTKPITILHHACKRIESGDLDFRINAQSLEGELRDLAQTFNTMLDKLSHYLKKEIEDEKQRSKLQFHILQAQINPHFLYNTLDSIKWLAVLQNVPNISTMCTSLILLLKYNLSSSDVLTTVSAEIDSVKNYVTIQKFRYGDIFNVSYVIDPCVNQCNIIRFIIQPLVENCMLHGIDDLDTQYSITIQAFVSDDLLHIKVIDDGKGMSSETTEKLNAHLDKGTRFNHIGINNIHQRIVLQFGSPYGLHYTSEPNKGTTAEIILPFIL